MLLWKYQQETYALLTKIDAVRVVIGIENINFAILVQVIQEPFCHIVNS